MARALGRLGPPAAVVALVLVGWESWVRVRGTPDYVLPPPSQVAATAVDSAHLLPRHLQATLVETVAGLALGAVIGVALALLIVAVPLARRSLGPLLVASQTVPMIVLAPLFLIWFGIGLTPKVVLVALITFFPVAVSTVAGLDGADDELVDLVRALGGRTGALLRVVRIPAAIPSFFAGLRISSAYAVAGAVIGEANGGDRGLGVFINRSKQSFLVDRIFVAVAVVAALSALLYGLVGLLGRWATPWRGAADRPVVVPATPAVPVAGSGSVTSSVPPARPGPAPPSSSSDPIVSPEESP